jgi:4-oxalmesaconate hydratase
MIGAVRDIDPRTGHYFDDTLRYVTATPHLSDTERRAVRSENALRVYPRLAARLADQVAGAAASAEGTS